MSETRASRPRASERVRSVFSDIATQMPALALVFLRWHLGRRRLASSLEMTWERGVGRSFSQGGISFGWPHKKGGRRNEMTPEVSLPPADVRDDEEQSLFMLTWVVF